MFENKKIAVVIPAYNEETLISRVIQTVPEFVDHIIVIDDCSQDATVRRVQELENAGSLPAPLDPLRVELTTSPVTPLRAPPPRLVLIQHSQNQGVGGSIASGYKWCRDHQVDIAVVMAGDAQMDPAEMPALLQPIVEGKVDYAKGNRLFTGDAWNQIPKVRYLGNSMMSLLTKIASGYWSVADSQCGYTAINLKALKGINWDQMYKRYGQPNDLLVRLNIQNFRVVDVPVTPIYNIGEKSGIKPFRMTPKLAMLLLRLFFYRMVQKYIIRDFHPLIFFYTFGSILGLGGGLFGLYLVLYRLLAGPVAATSALLAGFIFITGLQSIMFAMWFDMDYNRAISLPLDIGN